MRKFFRLFSLILSLFSIFNAYAAFDINSLIEVTEKNNPQCVEYYTYKNKPYCSTKAFESSGINPKIKTYETQTIVFDNRPWLAVWGEKNPTITTVEYVPAGDNINQWNELVTSQFIPGLQEKITVKQYVDAMVLQLKKTGMHPIVNIIKESPQQIIFEFIIPTPSHLKQDELQIVRKANNGFYIVHYVIKSSDMGKENRQKWIRNLQNSHIN
ncbi:hypothetical protein Lnau_1768 [Legionella nautarum]|uniref:Uncharacterized protein n=1 Tax=Legionella nautarum TaxID=45070 RepID=A0A0W0WWT6_9GAMM|nr:hypothetical protein [Legionella nautarum]KTD36784.1 hypothetical protein Lnau_1768 [Legionella nautarum]